MRTSHSLPAAVACLLHLSMGAQSLTSSNSVPSVGTTELRQLYTRSAPPAWSTSGTGNVWDASGVTSTGDPVTYVYQDVAGTPHAALHATSNLCASSTQSGSTSWYYWSVNSALANWVGVDGEVISGGRTACEYPFSIGDQFTDTYIMFGSTNTFTMEYVASGSIQAPFGTIDDVVMFSYNGGSSYELYRAGNVLRRIGVYVPGVQLEVSSVQVLVGVEEHALPALPMGPVPAVDHLTVDLPLNNGMEVVLMDLSGRPVRNWTSLGGTPQLGLEGISDGNYLLLLREGQVARALGRVVVAR